MRNEQDALVSECFYENLRKIKKCFKLDILRTLEIAYMLASCIYSLLFLLSI